MAKKNPIEKLVAHLEEQGCKVRATKGGYFLYHPDGTTTFGFHTSKPSDARTLKNIRADVLRSGLTWPPSLD